MKLNTQRSFVKVEGSQEDIQFSLKLGPKLLKLLSDSLYSDKQLAIIRELSVNGLDSHKEKGNEATPLEITLPSFYANNLIIRDFGTGMTPDKIRKIFSIYGESDKDDNNLQTGCLGIGSKSPFSYNTKSFTIESFCDNKHYIWSSYLNEEGMPTLSLLSEVASTEQTGVKITIPCLAGDSQNFANAAKKVFMWWKVKPKFLGNKVDIPEIKTVLTGTASKWQLRAENYHLQGSYAIMGSLAYPISFQDSSLSQEHKDLMVAPINIEFDLGDLDISASREALSYDARTKSKIVSRFVKIVDELTTKVETEVSTSKCAFDARKKVAQVLHKLPSHSLQKIIKLDKLNFQGKPLFDKNTVDDTTFSIDSNIGVRYFEKGYNNRIRIRSSHSVDLGARFEFFESDLKNGNQVRVRECFEGKVADYDHLFLLTFQDQLQKQKFLDIIGGVDSHLIKTSSLPKPAPSGRSGTGNGIAKTSKVMLFNNNPNFHRISTHWTSTTIDHKTDSGIYVEFNKFRFKDKNGVTTHPRELIKYINNINDLGSSKTGFVKIDKVYGIKSYLISKLDPTKWTNLFDFLPKVVNDFVANNDFLSARELKNCVSIGGYNAQYRRHLPDSGTLGKISTRLSSQHPFSVEYKKITDAIATYNKYANSVDAFNNLIPYCQVNITPPKVDKPNVLIDNLYKKYPLLPFIDYSYLNDFAHVSTYLEKMEK